MGNGTEGGVSCSLCGTHTVTYREQALGNFSGDERGNEDLGPSPKLGPRLRK